MFSRNKKISVFIILVIVGLVFLGKDNFSLSTELQPQTNAVSNCPLEIFDKSAVVFGVITICATQAVSEQKLTHAAHVAAQWLDNDQDGIADNPLINQKLFENKATLVMALDDFGAIGDQLFNSLEEQQRFGQDLYAIETNNPQRRDASQEEIHHLIIGAGWAGAYPNIFSDHQPESSVYKSWQVADEKGYYTYFDPTCDDQCKVMEFIYKSSAAYLGAKSDLAGEEFTLKNRFELRQNLPSIVEIYESAQYRYPTIQWPDGNYKFTNHIKILMQAPQKEERQSLLQEKLDMAFLKEVKSMWPSFKALEKLIDEGADVNAEGTDGYTPLVWASGQGDVDIVKFLLNKGADPGKSVRNGFLSLRNWWHFSSEQIMLTEEMSARVSSDHQKLGWTALYFAARAGHLEIVQLLLKARDKNIVDIQDHYGESPLFQALKFKHIQVAYFLLSKTNNIQDPKILEAAVYSENIDILKKLVKRQLEYFKAQQQKRPSDYGEAALFIAVSNGYVDLAKLLLQEAMTLKNIVHEGEFLHYAALNGHLAVIKMLLAKGFDVNIQNADGQTPLHYAAMENRQSVFKFLVQQGADHKIADISGMTVRDIAATQQYDDLLDFIDNFQKR